jgi:hypothetical protein
MMTLDERIAERSTPPSGAGSSPSALIWCLTRPGLARFPGRREDAASVLTDRFADLLERPPAGIERDRLALETRTIQRERALVDGASLLRIALARGPGGLSLPQTSAWASMPGIAELGNPGVKYRLNQATAFLAALVERLLAGTAQSTTGVRRLVAPVMTQHQGLPVAASRGRAVAHV